MSKIYGTRSTDEKNARLARSGAGFIKNDDTKAGIDQAIKALSERELQLQDQLRRGAGVPDSEANKEESDFQATGGEE